MFFFRAWRNSSITKRKTVENCITTNCYWGIEINAHALINFTVLCREKNYEFDITLLQSQTCESFFRAARSFTSTESTVVNFNMQTFESRLNRIEAKIGIMHSRKDDFIFPQLRTIDEQQPERGLPSDATIIEIVEKSQAEAVRLLKIFELDKPDFSESIYIREPKTKRGDNANFEFVAVPEHFEQETGVDVFDIEEINMNISSELHVKDSKDCNSRNTFKIRDKSGKVVDVKKSTFIWMLKEDVDSRVSTDRVHRFNEKSNKEPIVLVHENQIRENVVVGEWLLIKFDNSFLVTKVYQFTYLSGKRKAYSGLTAPVEAPEGVDRKGIGLRGNFFDLIYIEGEYRLEMVEKSEKMCVEIENYVSHLEKPKFTSQGFVIYSGRSADYLSSKIV